MNIETKIPTAVLGQGTIGGEISRLLTTDNWRLNLPNDSCPLSLKHIIVRPIINNNPSDHEAQEEIRARARMLDSSAFLPSDPCKVRFKPDPDNKGGAIIFDNEHIIKFTLADLAIDNPRDPGWSIKDWQPDTLVTIEATGAIKTPKDYQIFLERLGTFVHPEHFCLTTHNVDGAPFLVLGINEDNNETREAAASSNVVSNGSCTTKCAGVIIAPTINRFGYPDFASIRTVHGLTNSNKLFPQASHKKPGKKRGAIGSINPTTTGAGKGLRVLFPELTIDQDPISFRVQEMDASCVEIGLFYPARTTGLTEEAIVDALRQHAEKYPQVIGVSDKTDLVSQDVHLDTRAAVVPADKVNIQNAGSLGQVVRILGFYPHSLGSSAQAIYAAQEAIEIKNRA